MNFSSLSTAFLLILFCSTHAVGQTTAIPDENFEQALIDLGIDDVLDGTVVTDSINTLSNLAVNSKEITDLTGIDAFLNLSNLNCADNELTNLDLSGNTNLELLNCASNELIMLNITSCENLVTLIAPDNSLTTIDISNNTELDILTVEKNQLSELDVSNNVNIRFIIVSENELTSLDVINCPMLLTLACQDNDLTTLDLSQNENLTDVYCQNNDLNALNIRNGNNTGICSECFSCFNNVDLDCVEVDDPTYSTATWLNKNDHTSFETSCNLSNGSHEEFSIDLYPNPAQEVVFIHIPSGHVPFSLYDMNGALKKTGTLTPGVNSIDLSELTRGIYIIQFFGNDQQKTVKVSIL